MCAIAGLSGQFSQGLLAEMLRLIAYRGLDDQGVIELKNGEFKTALGHQRLSIIDLSPDGHQPMTIRCSCCQSEGSRDQKLWLVFNGEIYNYRALRQALIHRGHIFYSKTDSEVLIHLYAEYGVSMLSQLKGVYAFALYDGRPSGQKEGIQPGDLWIVRDELGVKPLYYTETSQGFLFASELKSLLVCPSVSRELDLTAIDQYVTYLWCPSPRTPLKQVKKLKPGYALLVRRGQVIRHWQHYDIPYGKAPLLTGSFEVLATETAQHVRKAVERQLVADVPIGAFLSGGLDSSSIVAFMRQLHPEMPIQCYTIKMTGHQEGFAEDLPYARQVAKHLGVNLHTVEAKSDMIQQLGKMLFHLDEPQADPAPINALLISELARQQGIKVLMSGAGGDDILSGYRRHYALQFQRYWQWLPQIASKAMAHAARGVMSGKGVGVNHAILRRLSKLLASCDLTGDAFIASFFEWNTSALRYGLYQPEVKQQLLAHRAQPLLSALQNIPSETEALNKMLYLDSKYFLTDHNLNYTDKMSMAMGVEVRVPLLDVDLVNFATRIPVPMKQQGRIGKAIFKKAMEPYLPREVIYRPKTGFGAPLRQWMRGPLKPMLDLFLSESVLQKRGLFEPKAVQHLIQQDRAGRVDGAYTIFSLLCIELWLQQFVDVTLPFVVTL